MDAGPTLLRYRPLRLHGLLTSHATAALVLAVALPAFGSIASPVFEANRGQYQTSVEYVARSATSSTAVKRSGLETRAGRDSVSIRYVSPSNAECGPEFPFRSEANYLNLSPAVTHVPQYPSVICRHLYPGIDWAIRAVGGSIEQDWRLAPHASAAAIDMQSDDGSNPQITSAGALEFSSGNLKVTWRKPIAWQQIGPERREVQVAYHLRGRRISLRIGSYRHDLPLVVDPVIDSSYLIQGNGDEFVTQTALDQAGNVYIAGLTRAADFQTTPGAVFTSPGAPDSSVYQAFVRKLAADGSTLIYSTYVGVAFFQSPHPLGMRVDSGGDIYLAANVFNRSLPVTGTPIDPGGAVAVYKIAPGGDSLIYATRVMPQIDYTDPVALAIDATGSAYVGAGSMVIDIAKIDPTGATRTFNYTDQVSNYFGGLADLAVGSDGSVYAAGTTGMNGLVTTPGVLGPTVSNTESHGYLIRLKPDGSGPIFSTYIAGDDEDGVDSLAIDSQGFAYVGGGTQSYQQSKGIQGTLLGIAPPADNASTAFVMKVNPLGTAAAFSTLLPGDSVTAVAMDRAGNLYTAGAWIDNNPFPYGPVIAVSSIDPSGQTLRYYSAVPIEPSSAYFTYDTALGLVVDSQGAAYLAGSSLSATIPAQGVATSSTSSAFLLKFDPAPDQTDVQVSVQSNPGTIGSGGSATVVFSVSNAGPAMAQSVVFSTSPLGSVTFACQASGSGICAAGSPVPRVDFPAIPPGSIETVTLVISTSSIAPSPVAISVRVTSLTSDLDQNNNFTTAQLSPNTTLVSVNSYLGSATLQPLNLTYQITGTLNTPVPGRLNLPNVATPGSQFQVYWPSPQITNVGGYPALFLQWSDGNTSNPRTFTATGATMSVSAFFQLLTMPYLSPSGITNSASYAAGGVSPGELVTIFGANISVPASGTVVNGAFATSIGNVQILFDGVPAPLIYVSILQANAIVPYSVAGKTSTTVTLQVGSGSAAMAVPVTPAAPGLFTANASGTGQVSALNQDLTVNSAQNPAHAGDIIVLYGTGEGLVSPIPPDGTISSAPTPVPVLPISVVIGNQQAQVLYAAEAPALTAGVIQINARIPAGISNNPQVPVAWAAGTISSPTGTTIAVK
jgi:uncharacterized protein (TIGR03437 family)